MLGRASGLSNNFAWVCRLTRYYCESADVASNVEKSTTATLIGNLLKLSVSIKRSNLRVWWTIVYSIQ